MIEEAVMRVPTFTASCDEALSAATMLMHWAEQGSRNRKCLYAEEYLRRVVSESFKTKIQNTLIDSL